MYPQYNKFHNMKSIISILILILCGYSLNAQVSKVMPGNIIARGDSITLYPYPKVLHGVQVIHIDRIHSNDSLTLVYYLKKLNVPQDSGKLYLKSNEVVRLFFYRNFFKGWVHGVPTGIDLINFNNYLNTTQ
jgi:hypothetical protein